MSSEKLDIDRFQSHLRLIVEAESPSTDPQATHDCADVVATIASELGVQLEKSQTGPFPVLTRNLRNPSATLVACHLDTVWPIGTISDRPFRVRDGRILGPGVLDMKAGLLLALYAASASSDRDVAFVITADEEAGSIHGREAVLKAASGVSQALIPEFAQPGEIKVARAGTATYGVRIVGHSSHAGTAPEAGASALTELSRQVLALESLSDSQRRVRVTATGATVDSLPTSIPHESNILLDLRYWDDSSGERLSADIESATPITPGTTLSVQRKYDRPSLQRSSRLVEVAQGVAANLDIGPLNEVSVGGASDGNFLSAIGIDTLDGLGAAGGGAHSTDEHVLLNELETRFKLLLGLFDHFAVPGSSQETDLQVDQS